MKSKFLLVANILSTLYSCFLLWAFGSAINELGGFKFLAQIHKTLESTSDLRYASLYADVIYLILILAILHIAAFVSGATLGWVAYFSKKSGLAKFAAVLYLVGTACYPAYYYLSIPIAVLGFVGGYNQKKLNKLTDTSC